MIVKTQSGTVYEFRIREIDITDMSDETPRSLKSGWEGCRHNDERTLHAPIKEWSPVALTRIPEIGLRFPMQFEGYEEWLSTAVQWIEISDKEREAFNA
jgi:hypothetical protein